ncbi:hypothetical protein PLG01_01358 [Streptococcus mutans PKUSS-LG01]|nr:hypothetical protein PLG01_01358 [Streptococcus mutans PKUSS-LG01]
MCKWLSRIGYKLLLVFSSILPKKAEIGKTAFSFRGEGVCV